VNEPSERVRVLAIGFGTWHALVALAQAVGDSGKVYGIDISERILNKKLSKYLDCRLIFVGESLEEVGFQVVDSELWSMWGLPVEIVVAKDFIDARGIE
jgi:hypothetical protein